MNSIAQKIATGIPNLTPEMEEAVVQSRLEKLSNKWTPILIRAWEEIEKLRKEGRKINRPDDVKYDIDGKTVQEFYSKSRLDEIKKNRDKIEKITKAFNACLALKPKQEDLDNQYYEAIETMYDKSYNELSNLVGGQNKNSGDAGNKPAPSEDSD